MRFRRRRNQHNRQLIRNYMDRVFGVNIRKQYFDNPRSQFYVTIPRSKLGKKILYGRSSAKTTGAVL